MYINQVEINNAWETTMGNSCILVGVLDSGLDWMHEDLGIGQDLYQNIWLNPGEDIWSNPNNPNSGNGIDDDGDGLIDNWKGWNYDFNSNDVRTNNPHGTQVAGIISAKMNNSQGIAGIAGGNNQEGAKLLPICIGVDAPNGAVLDDAILHAVDKGARIIQISATIGQTTAIDAAIAHAVNNGVTVVCATGNNNGPVGYPASNVNTISVGATNQNDQRASFSNFGSNLVIAAPGVNIRSTVLNNGYGDGTGTSFAAPNVSGTIALMLSINPTLSPQVIKDIITSTADKVGGYNYVGGHSNQLGYGRLNSYAAVQAVMSISGPDRLCTSTTNYSLAYPPSGATVTWTASPSSLFVNASGSGSTAALNATHFTNNGAGTLTFTVETDCGSFESSRRIWVGAPSHNNLTLIANQYPNCANELTYFNAHYTGTEPGNKNSDILSYSWDHPVYCYTGGQKNEVLICNFPYAGYHYQIRVSASNSCGLGGPIFEDLYASYCFYYAADINPNPANGMVNIELTETPVDEAAKAVLQSGKTQSIEYQQYSFNNPEYRIRIYDMQARERYCMEAGSGSLRESLDISVLPPGLYIVHIEHSNGTIIRQLKVE